MQRRGGPRGWVGRIFCGAMLADTNFIEFHRVRGYARDKRLIRPFVFGFEAAENNPLQALPLALPSAPLPLLR